MTPARKCCPSSPPRSSARRPGNGPRSSTRPAGRTPSYASGSRPCCGPTTRPAGSCATARRRAVPRTTIGRARQRGPRHRHRPVQAAGADRRGRLRRRLHGRADRAGPPQGRAEGPQAGHGHPAGGRPLRGRAAGPGDHGPPEHRQGVRRRRHAIGPAVLRDGAGQGRADHRVLRPEPPDAAATAGAVRPGLPGGAARPPEGDHPPRPEAVQRPGHAARHDAGGRR